MIKKMINKVVNIIIIIEKSDNIIRILLNKKIKIMNIDSTTINYEE